MSGHCLTTGNLAHYPLLIDDPLNLFLDKVKRQVTRPDVQQCFYDLRCKCPSVSEIHICTFACAHLTGCVHANTLGHLRLCC